MASSMRHQARRAGLEDAQQIAMLFRVAYGQSSHPCSNEKFILQTLRRRCTDIWYVSDIAGRITGCMGMLVNRWNRSWEIVRGITDPEFHGRGIATLLAQRAVDGACSSEDCDIIIGFPRNRTMYRILSEAVTPGMCALGHDGAINVACGRREYHLAALAVPRRARFEWRNPSGLPPDFSDLIVDAVLEPLGLSWIPGPYPPQFISGEITRDPNHGPFLLHYQAFCPSYSLEISGYTGLRERASQVAADLIEALRSFECARHVRVAVLADKLEFQAALLRAGFVITAYLPAWHHQNGVRYDCVLMVRRPTDVEPADYNTREIIDLFDAIYGKWSKIVTA
jgi:hypothetical protein